MPLAPVQRETILNVNGGPRLSAEQSPASAPWFRASLFGLYQCPIYRYSREKWVIAAEKPTLHFPSLKSFW